MISIDNLDKQILFKRLFWAISGLLLLLMTTISIQYGMTEDAPVHQEHGKRILDFFKWKSNEAQLSPLDENGNYINISNSNEELIKGMNGFGGFFDLVTNFLYASFDSNSIGIYEFRNIISAILGFLMFLFCGLIGKEIGGWRLGLWSLGFVVLCPVLFGQSMNSPKDIPFAAFYTFATFHLIKLIQELPKISIKRAAFLIFNVSILINIRLLGLVFIGNLFLLVALAQLWRQRKIGFDKFVIKEWVVIGSKTLGIGFLGYLAASIFWPLAQTNPITIPIELFMKLKDYKGFVSTQLFEGQWRMSYNMPWYYAFKSLLFLTVPLHIFLGILLIPVIFVKSSFDKKTLVFVLLFLSLFPLFLSAIGKANSYDNARHFIFVVPIMAVVASVVCFFVIGKISVGWYQKTGYMILGVILLQPLYFMIKNHPYQALYFSPLIGGVEGAYGKYEIDYLGFGIRPALEWLQGNAEKPARVRMYYGEQVKASYYLDQMPDLKHVEVLENTADWDYGIVMLTEAKFDKNLDNWPPKNTIHSEKVNGIPFCFIVKNDFETNGVQRLEKELQKNPTASGYMQLGLEYFKKADYINSLKASKRSVKIEKSSIAYNNICSAYNMLMMYEEAITAGGKALEIDQNMQLVKNNITEAKRGLEAKAKQGWKQEKYLNLSYNYYRLGDYEKCIETSKKLLEIYPNTPIAYNNICSANNELKRYDLAIEACKQALLLQSNFELAKNNLNYAKSQKEKE